MWKLTSGSDNRAGVIDVAQGRAFERENHRPVQGGAAATWVGGEEKWVYNAMTTHYHTPRQNRSGQHQVAASVTVT
jgi:hypothetical protein